MPCSGTPVNCTGLALGKCLICGCEWTDPPGSYCRGGAAACSSHGSQATCENCGCDWGTNIQINVGDVWRDVSELQINVGDTWRTVTEVWINVGDTWRQVF